MKAKHDAVEILRELIGISIFPKVTFDHSLEEGNRYYADPFTL
jgi:hypothetical protein